MIFGDIGSKHQMGFGMKVLSCKFISLIQIFTSQLLFKSVDKHFLIESCFSISTQLIRKHDILLHQDFSLPINFLIEMLEVSLLIQLLSELSVMLDQFLILEGEIFDDFQDVLHLDKRMNTLFLWIFILSKRRQSTYSF